MKKFHIRLLLLFVFLIILGTTLCISVFATDNSEPIGGTFAGTLKWEFDPETATLTVSGEGPIPDFRHGLLDEYASDAKSPPWFNREETWKKIKRVVIEEGVTEVGMRAFSVCPLLEEVELPSTLRSIGFEAFTNPKLHTVRFSPGLQSIETAAFRDCVALKEVVLYEGLTELGRAVFGNCTALETVVLPESLRTLGHRMFYGCSSLKNVTVSNSLEKIDGKCFSDCTALETVDLSDTVTEIGERAFSGCSSLSSFRIPAGVKVIPSGTFTGCTSLEALEIPETLEELRDAAYCKTLHIPKTLRYIASIPSTVEVLTLDPESPYYRMEEDCVIENGTDRVIWGRYATKIPECAKKIAMDAFANAMGLREAVIPEGMTRLSGGFDGCVNLERIVIHKNVTWIGFGLLDGVPSVKSVEIDPENEYYRSDGRSIIRMQEYKQYGEEDGESVLKVYFPANSLICYDTSDPFPEGVECILKARGMAEEYRIPDGVESLDGLGFHMENLRSVTIPKSVVKIYAGFFQNCPNLTDIYYEGTTEESRFVIPYDSNINYWDTVRIHCLGDEKKPTTTAPAESETASAPEGCGSVIAEPWAVLTLSVAGYPIFRKRMKKGRKKGRKNVR